jgi:small-conductance mechanosensitive channel
LTIALDKPFVIGDFIVVGAEMGTIEHVGLKTTRVRSLSGEQLVFGNADLLSSRIRNYKRMNERRVLVGFGVTYSTPPETLEAVNGLVREAVEAQANVRFDRCHFHRFGASSLDYEAVYYINSPDYNVHMDVQQAVHLAIARAFRERGIEFAFPTQTLFLAGENAVVLHSKNRSTKSLQDVER